MAKTCLEIACPFPVFGKNYCKYHQYLRKDKKVKTLMSSPIKKVSTKGKKKIQLKIKASKQDKLFFQEIWEEREHIDFETGEYLGEEACTFHFHHVWPKSLYPNLRYVKKNIVLVSLTTHAKAESNIDFTPLIKAYREKINYLIF